MTRSVAVVFEGMPPSRHADAAARRRTRIIDMSHPAVVAWEVRLAAAQRPVAGGLDYAATVQARVAGGEALVGEGRAMDLLGALRLAFMDVETHLDAHQERVRARAGQWLATVRQRLSQRQEDSFV
jgi:hypothetical protein